MKVEYDKLLDTIASAVINHKKEELIAAALIRNPLNLNKLSDPKELNWILRNQANQVAVGVIIDLKKLLGSDFIITEDGQEMDFEND